MNYFGEVYFGEYQDLLIEGQIPPTQRTRLQILSPAFTVLKVTETLFTSLNVLGSPEEGLFMNATVTDISNQVSIGVAGASAGASASFLSPPPADNPVFTIMQIGKLTTLSWDFNFAIVGNPEVITILLPEKYAGVHGFDFAGTYGYYLFAPPNFITSLPGVVGGCFIQDGIHFDIPDINANRKLQLFSNQFALVGTPNTRWPECPGIYTHGQLTYVTN